MKLALDRNLDIAVQRLNPQINDIAIVEPASRSISPTLTSQVFSRSQANPSTNTIAGSSVAGASIDSKLTTYNGGIAQSFPWGGGSLVGRAEQQPADLDGPTSLFNPVYNTNWSGTYTQPLMRGFKTDSTRQQIQVTKINRDISDIQLKSSITNTLSNVRNAYWDFVYAVQSVDVARQSLDAGEQARAGQPDARAGRHDGADRRGLGAIGAGDARPGRWSPPSPRSGRPSSRLKRLIVGGADDPNWAAAPRADRSTRFSAGRDRSRRAPSGGLSATARTWRSRRRTSRPTTSRCAISTIRRCRRSTCWRPTGWSGSAGRQLITEGTGVNRTVVGSAARRLWRRAGIAVPIELSRPGPFR